MFLLLFVGWLISYCSVYCVMIVCLVFVLGLVLLVICLLYFSGLKFDFVGGCWLWYHCCKNVGCLPFSADWWNGMFGFDVLFIWWLVLILIYGLICFRFVLLLILFCFYVLGLIVCFECWCWRWYVVCFCWFLGLLCLIGSGEIVLCLIGLAGWFASWIRLTGWWWFCVYCLLVRLFRFVGWLLLCLSLVWVGLLVS